MFTPLMPRNTALPPQALHCTAQFLPQKKNQKALCAAKTNIPQFSTIKHFPPHFSTAINYKKLAAYSVKIKKNPQWFAGFR
jgi:hypothetical protein